MRTEWDDLSFSSSQEMNISFYLYLFADLQISQFKRLVTELAQLPVQVS